MIKKIKNRINFFVLSLVLISQNIFAENIAVLHKPKGSFGDLKDMMVVILNGIIKVSIPVLVLATIYVGFLFVKAQGNAEELKKARAALIWLVVGAAIILGGNAIYSMIFDTVKELKV